MQAYSKNEGIGIWKMKNINSFYYIVYFNPALDQTNYSYSKSMVYSLQPLIIQSTKHPLNSPQSLVTKRPFYSIIYSLLCSRITHPHRIKFYSLDYLITMVNSVNIKVSRWTVRCTEWRVRNGKRSSGRLRRR